MPRVLSPIEPDAFEAVRLAEHAAMFLGIAATKAKNTFGAVIERCMVRPVIVFKNDRPAAVVLSPETYLKLVHDQEELLTLKAIEAEGEGYLSADETADFFAAAERRLHGKG